MKYATKPVHDVKDILDRIDDYHLPPEKFLNKNYGRGTWCYDAYSGYYIVADDLHTGPGRGFIVVNGKDLHSKEWVLPAHHLI
jgi:hypothetical protein